jgi:prepilin-type N-terminal cleavage/methylation domain-containing protein
MKRGRKAFTLVELLVVLAIIAVLLAILLPVLSRARRTALVLASPIAYRGADGTVHLTDPGGGADVPIASRATTVQCPVCHAPPQWSPSGQMLAFRFSYDISPRVAGFTVIANPMSIRVRMYRHSEERFFMGWSDSDSVIEMGNVSFERFSASNHHFLQRLGDLRGVRSVSPCPPGAPGPYVGKFWLDKNPYNTPAIGFLKRDLAPGKIIYSTWQVPLERPRIDPLGEYIAWTQGNPPRIAFKHVRDPVLREPTIVGGQFLHAVFCDWSENDNLLGNVSDDSVRWYLAVFDKKGRLIKKLSAPTPPGAGYVASWRKYQHR